MRTCKLAIETFGTHNSSSGSVLDGRQHGETCCLSRRKKIKAGKRTGRGKSVNWPATADLAMFLINDKDTQFKKHWICLRALTVRACSQAAGGRPAGGLRVCVTLNFDPLSLLSLLFVSSLALPHALWTLDL